MASSLLLWVVELLPICWHLSGASGFLEERSPQLSHVTPHHPHQHVTHQHVTHYHPHQHDTNQHVTPHHPHQHVTHYHPPQCYTQATGEAGLVFYKILIPCWFQSSVSPSTELGKPSNWKFGSAFEMYPFIETCQTQTCSCVLNSK